MHSFKYLKDPILLFKLTLYSGMFGAILMFTGDMIMFKSFVNTSGGDLLQNYFTKLAQVDKHSLFIGSYLGPLSLPFYIFGFYHFYLFFKKQSIFIALSLFVIFVFSISFNVVYHSSFANLAIASNLQQSHIDNELIIKDVNQIIDFSVYLFKIADTGFKAGIALLIFSGLVYKSKINKLYFILSPLVLIYVNIPLVKILPAPIGGIIAGGYSNLVFFIYFAISLILLPKNIEYDK